MPTRWNPNWPESRKKVEREKRRRKYALSRLQAGKSYQRKDSEQVSIPQEQPSQRALEVLEQAAKKFIQGGEKDDKE